MMRFLNPMWLFGILAMAAVPAQAQEKPAAPAAGAAAPASTAPTVRSMVTGGDTVLKKLEGVMKLSTPADQKMWPRFLEYFEVFLVGVDRTKETRMDILLDEVDQRYTFCPPIATVKGSIDKGLQEFRNNNLAPLGITSRQERAQTYVLGNAFKGYLRFKDGYASIAEKKTDIPPTMPDPRKDIANLVKEGFDVAVEGSNVAAGVKERQELAEKRRANFFKTFKRKETESVDDFEIRKAFAEVSFDESQRMYVEGSHFLLGGKTDGKTDVKLTFALSPLAGTALDESIRSQGTKPSKFACVERVDDPILSGRINFPLDKMRQANVIKLSKVMRTASQNEIDAGKERSADEKAAAKKAAGLFFDMIDAGAKTGRIDGFVEAHANKSGKNTLVWGVVPADGDAMLEILDLLPKTSKDNKVEKDVATEGAVKIHKVTVPTAFRADAKDFFGDETVYIGTSKDLLYLAAGENSLEELKAAIRAPMDEKAAEKTASSVIDGFIKLAPWMEQLHKHRGKKGDVKMRERAVTAFKAGDDVLTIKLNRDDLEAKGDAKAEPRVTGAIEGKAGVLRFIGATMAEFTRNIDK